MSPARLPGPPGLDRLKTFPTLDKVPPRLYRLFQLVNEPEYFNDTHVMRFDPPPGVSLFGACYTGVDVVASFVETFSDFDIVTTEDVAARAIATIEVADTYRIADVTHGTVLGDFGLDARISVGDDYEVCQRWASAFYDAGFSRIHYAVRHDPGGRRRAVALFGDPGVHTDQIRVVGTDGITASLLQVVAADFHIHVVPPTVL